MKRFFRIVLSAAAALLPLGAAARLNVVATTEDLGAIARSVGGDLVSVVTLARPTEDPHFVDAKPSFIVKLNHADLLVDGGAELEIGWLPPLLQGARNPRLAAGEPGRVECAEGVSMLDVPATLDRSKGDLHAAGNPHYLVDPVNAKLAAGHVCDGLCRVDAAHADAYRANLVRFAAAVDAKLAEWQALLAPYQGARLAAYHDSWPYFARRFGLRIDLFLEPKPGIPPTPASLAAAIETIKAEHVRAIIIDPYQNRRTADAVARETGAAVVAVSQFPGGLEGTAAGYVELLDRVVRNIAAALGAR